MDDYPEKDQEPMEEEPSSRPKVAIWAVTALLVALCAVAISLGYVMHERAANNALAASNASMSSDVNQLRDQLQNLGARLAAVKAPPAKSPASANQPLKTAKLNRRPIHRVIRHARVARESKEDLRWKQVQAKLAEHDKELAEEQQDLQNTRSEMAGSLDSTRTELNGAIAKNHDELVELEKQGQRNYFEFDLTKSKSFQHVGPISVKLRKTNVKHGFYDVTVIIDDNPLDKKHVNLYEPVQFYTEGTHQPLELVVNRIGKNKVHGYVSAPKSTSPQQAASASPAQAAPATPPPSSAAASDASANLKHRPGTSF